MTQGEIRKQIANHWRSLVLFALILFVLIRVGVAAYRNHALKRSLIEQNTYEVSYSYVAAGERTQSYFMICEPPKEKDEIWCLVQRYVEEDGFLASQRSRGEQTVAELEADAKEKRPFAGMIFTFLEPSQALPIGVFPDDIARAQYQVERHMLCSVWVSFAGDRLEVEYL